MDKAAEEEGKDYRHILQQVIEQAEVVKEEDTLDPNLYLYGLECYGDVALVEPLEVTEKIQMNILILAVDTSGSCVNKIPKFLRETVSVLGTHYAEGGGGTDFCPVFRRVKEFKKAGQKIDAMFYFSDGNGTFPEEKHVYDTRSKG